ncbi:MAG: hypothetical protein ISR47_01700 [Rhodospirillales bacterium]|nr:hypothetical protein [Rhodospirillales bacterium]
MTTVRKFLFDNDFTEPDPPAPEKQVTEGELEEDVVEEPVIEEIVPTFSEEEVNAAREDGFAKGREDGIRHASEGTERHIADAVTLIGERVESLFAAHLEAVDKIQTSAVMVVSTLARKVLPQFSEREGLGEIERLAQTILGRLRMEPRVVFVVNDAIRDAVEERLVSMAESRTFGGTLEVIGDSGVAAGDCRIEWADGGAERNAAEMLADVDRIVAQNVDGTGAVEFIVPDLSAPDEEEPDKEPNIDSEPPDETKGEEDAQEGGSAQINDDLIEGEVNG